MATVDGRTRISIDELIESSIISGRVTSGGVLILTTRGGAEINAGFLASQPIRENWTSTATFNTGDITSYAGKLWRAQETNTNKPPYFNTALWVNLTGDNYSDWVELDPFFQSDDVFEILDVSTKVGSPVVSLTSIVGEHEGGTQALKIQLMPGESQRFFHKIENVVFDDEPIVVEIRAKLLSSAPTASLKATLIQNAPDGDPIFGAAGSISSTTKYETGELGTTWQTLRFDFGAYDAKPRSVVNFVAASVSDVAVLLIQSIRIFRGSSTETGDYYTKDEVDDMIDALEITTMEFEQEYTFSSASSTWTINHMQGTKALNVLTKDTLGNELHGDVTYPSDNQMQIKFYYAQTGTALVWE